MSINRNNYEEYFLLYNDNELTGPEKRMVEEFVAQNIDLREEFELLKELKLDPTDEIRFDKSSLYKPITLQDDQLQPTAEQEKLLLYLDNELDKNDKVNLEAELQSNAALNQEFELLSKTKTIPDLTIVHPDKTSLYRKEEQVARIVRITWVRMAVAAALILIMGLLWLNRSAEPSAVAPVIASLDSPGLKTGDQQAKRGNQNPENSVGIDDASTPGEIAANSPVSVPDITINPATGNVTKDITGSGSGTVKPDRKGTVTITRMNPVDVAKQGVALVAKPEFNDNITSVTTQHINTKDVTAVTPVNQSAKEIVDMPSISTVKSDYATEALMSDIADEEPEVLVQDNSPRKGAFRGLIRKANRFVNKVTNPDSNGPSVKVASFEIALAK